MDDSYYTFPFDLLFWLNEGSYLHTCMDLEKEKRSQECDMVIQKPNDDMMMHAYMYSCISELM